MRADDLMFDDELETLLLDADDVITGFRDRYGSHHVGSFDEDPEMLAYEELLRLGRTLAGY